MLPILHLRLLLHGRRPAVSDTPRTDALREVIVGQYKEDELTGNGMGNILSALTDIETLERERECECKCDVDWPEEYYELRQRLERERDAALRKLESLEESIASLDHPNIRILLRQAERYALDVAEKHENKYREIKKQLTDNNAERALADRLAEALMSTDSIIRKEVSLIGQWSSPDVCKEALAAWKEARNEI